MARSSTDSFTIGRVLDWVKFPIVFSEIYCAAIVFFHELSVALRESSSELEFECAYLLFINWKGHG